MSLHLDEDSYHMVAAGPLMCTAGPCPKGITRVPPTPSGGVPGASWHMIVWAPLLFFHVAMGSGADGITVPQ
eukprot:1663138-Karenia_brevis.AAC.1